MDERRPRDGGGLRVSGKRTTSPDLAADYAYQFYGIVGAQEYNGCEKSRDALADKVGINAVDDQTLEVKLTSAQPWFIRSPLALRSWPCTGRPSRNSLEVTEAANIVTNGPSSSSRGSTTTASTFVKNEEWRDADSISPTRVNGRMIDDATTSVQAYEAARSTST